MKMQPSWRSWQADQTAPLPLPAPEARCWCRLEASSCVSFALVRGSFLIAAVAGWPLPLLLSICSEPVFAQIILLLLLLIFRGLLLLHQTLGALVSLILTWLILQSWKVQWSNSLWLLLYPHCLVSQSTWLGNVTFWFTLYKMKDWRV